MKKKTILTALFIVLFSTSYGQIHKLNATPVNDDINLEQRTRKSIFPVPEKTPVDANNYLPSGYRNLHKLNNYTLSKSVVSLNPKGETLVASPVPLFPFPVYPRNLKKSLRIN